MFSKTGTYAIPLTLYTLGWLLLLSVFLKTFQNKASKIKLTQTYLALTFLLSALTYLSHAYWQTHFRPESFKRKFGHCAGLTGTLFGSGNADDPQTLTRLWAETLSPAKQYILNMGEDACLTIRFEAAIENLHPAFCKRPIGHSADCLNSFLNSESAVKGQMNVGLLIDLIAFIKSNGILITQPNELLLNLKRNLIDSIPQLKSVRADLLESRLNEIKGLNIEEWKKFIFDCFFGKIPTQAEAYLVFWIDQKLTEKLVESATLSLTPKITDSDRIPAQSPSTPRSTH